MMFAPRGNIQESNLYGKVPDHLTILIADFGVIILDDSPEVLQSGVAL